MIFHESVYISDKMDACLASVYSKWQACRICTDPLKLDITDLVMAGRNYIEIKLTNTLRNLLVHTTDRWGKLILLRI